MTERRETEVVVALTRAEALVLFEWLASRAGELRFDDPAEQRVLWRVEGALERALSEPFAPDYRALVAAARRTVNEDEAPE
ncbi:MAG: hypothetical protein R3B36_36490 [Polyangiaceae bacterium]